MNRLTPDDMRDALAFMRATATGDIEGRMAVAANCDPARMVDCMASYALGLASMAVDGGPIAWLDMLTANVEELDRLVSEAQEFRKDDEDGDGLA
ncbi:hypothetical protein ACN93_15105 [Gordonia paraffinivorans]|uniref:hypothetical protein n=1 Tax=Gordonia paraffinivorans TaxID=175628 RepID=UPI000D62243F|nr:hypothetical protein [Gordonia paraffinivorans]PWD42220.1 hypothetical protein ACN93_15105 [Gordonia paraffinivorans]